jgi:dTDP-4-amino-4,6-dideoxygalactose transaminase
VIAAFLWAQMEEADHITSGRLSLWERYHQALAPLEATGWLRRPIIPEAARHNAHMYYILLNSLAMRSHLIAKLKEAGILAVFHYVPLHLSPAGKRFARTHGDLPHTEQLADRLLRLPLWLGLGEHQDKIVEILTRTIRSERE